MYRTSSGLADSANASCRFFKHREQEGKFVFSYSTTVNAAMTAVAALMASFGAATSIFLPLLTAGHTSVCMLR